MDFGFRHDELLLAGARRIAREQVERAVAELGAESPSVDERVHEVRKRIKKLRGLLALLARSYRRSELEAWNDRLREAGRRLSAARRASVLLGSFDDLLAQAPDALSEPARSVLRAELERARADAVAALDSSNEVTAVTELLQSFLAELEASPARPRPDGPELLEPGLRRTYRRGKRQLARVRREPTSESFHEWRKLAKSHFYHLRLLRRIWPAHVKALSSALEQVGELLGLEHDLDDLRLWLLERPRSDELLPPMRTLLDLIQVRRRELRASALRIGARAFSERPRAFGRDFLAYFAKWRSGAEPTTDEPGLDP